MKHRIQRSPFVLMMIGTLAFSYIYSCKDSTSVDNFNPVGQWKYPASGKMDSTLSNFSIRLGEKDSVKFLGYLDGNLLDSTNGVWKSQNDSIFIALNECVEYGLIPRVTDPMGLVSDSCITQIKFTNDGKYLFDNSGKKFIRI